MELIATESCGHPQYQWIKKSIGQIHEQEAHLEILEGRHRTILNPLFMDAGVVQMEGIAGSGESHVFPHCHF